MSETIALDVHAHLIPVDAAQIESFDGVTWDDDAQVMNIDGHTVGLKPIYRPHALLDWMATNRVEHALISAPPPLYRQQLRGPEAREWTAYVNDGLADIVAKSDGRLGLLVHLPPDDPKVALDIARDWIARGHRRFSMPTGPADDRTLADDEYAPLWEVLNAAHAFVFFHPGECCDGRLKSFYLSNLLGNPFETAVALAHLIFSGVFERYPHLAPCFAHGGGLLPAAAGRFQRGFDTDRPGLNTEIAPPSDIMRRIYVDCICHSESAAILAEDTFGADQILFGSDWPFPMGLVEPHSQLGQYTAARRRRYFETNPKQLFAKLDQSNEEKP